MTAAVPPLVSLDDVLAARRLLAGVARQTPVQGMRMLSEQVGGPVVLKCENLQRTGSFKIRGAYVRISRMSGDERSRGVVAASAGNHAQGVALAAQLLDTRATVFMPEGAPIPKVAATKAYGAQVVHRGSTVDQALAAALAHAEETGKPFIHPFDHPDVIAGQGTVGLEIVEQVPDVRTIVVATGGGGLVAGVGVVVKALRPDTRVVAAQAAGAAAWPASLASGRPVPLDRMATIADGIAIGCPGEVTFRHVAQVVDDVMTCDDEALSHAIVHCLERAKLVVEPAGVAAVAAVMQAPRDVEPPVVALVTGGNIDPLLLARVVQHGLASAGRFLSLRVRIPDRPGELARLLAVLAATGANVMDVEHSRTGGGLHLNEVQVQLTVETRSAEHGEQVLQALRATSYATVRD